VVYKAQLFGDFVVLVIPPIELFSQFSPLDWDLYTAVRFLIKWARWLKYEGVVCIYNKGTGMVNIHHAVRVLCQAGA
jgi:hypothetical protein